MLEDIFCLPQDHCPLPFRCRPRDRLLSTYYTQGPMLSTLYMHCLTSCSWRPMRCLFLSTFNRKESKVPSIWLSGRSGFQVWQVLTRSVCHSVLLLLKILTATVTTGKEAEWWWTWYTARLYIFIFILKRRKNELVSLVCRSCNYLCSPKPRSVWHQYWRCQPLSARKGQQSSPPFTSAGLGRC